MKKFLLTLCCATLFVLSQADAGTEAEAKAFASPDTTEAVPLDLFHVESSYVFESDLNHGGSFGKQDEIQESLEYGHRTRLTGNYYFRLGFSYERFDFGSTNAPVPNHLQSIDGVFGVDYMRGSDVGAFLHVSPGFYFQNHIGISSFDAQITLGAIKVLQEDKLYLFGGAYVSFLRGGIPVLPLAGVVWIPSKQWRLMAVLPDPKLIYSPTDRLDLWVGGQLRGGSYRTDRNDDIRPTKLNGAQIERFNLAQQPLAFAENTAVKAFLESSGQEALPLVLVKGEVAMAGRYPSRAELGRWAGIAQSAAETTSDGVYAALASNAAKPSDITS
jgi:hypothetical protein